MRRLVGLLACCTALAACEGEKDEVEDKTANDAVKAAVEQRMTAYVAAVRSANADSIGAFWAEDARNFEPDAAELSRQALITTAVGLLKVMNVTSVDIRVSETTVHDEGTIAWQIGDGSEKLTPKDGKGTAVDARFSFAMRWKKQTNGAWLADRFIETPLPKPAVAAAAGK